MLVSRDPRHTRCARKLVARGCLGFIGGSLLRDATSFPDERREDRLDVSLPTPERMATFPNNNDLDAVARAKAQRSCAALAARRHHYRGDRALADADQRAGASA